MMQHEIDQFTNFAVYYLLPVAFIALFFGFIAGWRFCSTRPTYCQDCMWPGSEPVKDSDNEDK
jgi:hypothetical protein